MKMLVLTVGLLIAPIGAAQAQTAPLSAEALREKILNAPSPASYVVWGDTARSRLIDDAAVQGGKALRVTVASRGPQPWSTNVSAPTVKPIKAGREVMMLFWARLAKGDRGATTAMLPNNSVQLAKQPHTTVFGGPVTIGPEWKLHQIKGRTTRDYAAGEIAVSLHLATGRQTIDLGPVFVVDLGGGAS